MSNCQGCGQELPPSRGGPPRKWCSPRCRKQTLYSGTCEQCGGRTSGSGGPNAAAVVCASCLQWTSEQIIDAIQRWAAEHGGIPPTYAEWQNPPAGFPAHSTVARRIGGWNEALLRAGFALHCDRRPETQEWIEEQLRLGRGPAEVADALGVTPQAIYERLKHRGQRMSDLRTAA